jgi:hypothetical protein
MWVDKYAYMLSDRARDDNVQWKMFRGPVRYEA